MDQPPQPTGFPAAGTTAPSAPSRFRTDFRPAAAEIGGTCSRYSGVFLMFGLLGFAGAERAAVRAVGLLGIGTFDSESGVTEKYHSLNRHGTEKVAILSIEGTIISGEGFFKQQIDHAMKDWKDGRSEGDCGPRQFARRHHHRQRLHAALPPQTGGRNPHSSRR